MIGVFSVRSATKGADPKSIRPEEEEHINRAFDNLYSSLPTRHRSATEELIFGNAGNGIAAMAWVNSMNTQLVIDHKDEVTVFFRGNLTNNPTDMEDAEFVLYEYLNWSHYAFNDETDSSGDSEHPSTNSLLSLQGEYMFILYDKRNGGRIMVARNGAESLCWGTVGGQPANERLYFASDRSLIEGECSDISDFPPGKIFLSDMGGVAGRFMEMTNNNRSTAGRPKTLKMTDLYSESANNLSGMVNRDAAGSDMTID